ncbi:MAG TPA: hypothetical protein PKC69_05340 [Chitinophagaceae bacterium]|nr:hypothetical protein [Chitinophagaceae bacterium]
MKTKNLIALIALAAILYQSPLFAQSDNPFTSATTTHHHSTVITGFQITEQNGRLLFDWSVTANEEVYLFELEKSRNGKDFTTAAVIFSTDNKESDQYRYFEKASGAKTYYRLKLVTKDNRYSYSSVLAHPEAGK